MIKTNTQKEMKNKITIEEDLMLASYLKKEDFFVVIHHILKTACYDEGCKDIGSLTRNELDNLPNYWWVMILLHNPEYTELCENWKYFNNYEKGIILKYRKDLINKF